MTVTGKVQFLEGPKQGFFKTYGFLIIFKRILKHFFCIGLPIGLPIGLHIYCLRQQPGPGPAGSWAGPAWFKMLLGLGGNQGGGVGGGEKGGPLPPLPLPSPPEPTKLTYWPCMMLHNNI